MFNLPLHPVVVHFPIVLGSLLPFLALMLWWAIKKEFLQQKFTHKPLKEDGCESCHLRHGVVGKVLLSKQGNELCIA